MPLIVKNEPNEFQRRGPIRPTPRIAEGSEQQEAFWTEGLYGEKNVILDARAGAAKSSSARELHCRLIEAYGDKYTIRHAAFGRDIADSFAVDAHPLVDVGTTHSFGYRLLRDAFGSTLDDSKTFGVLDEIDPHGKVPRYLRAAIKRAVELAKDHCLVPMSDFDKLAEAIEDLCLKYGVQCWEKPQVVSDLAVRILRASYQNVDVVDYGDLIWLPVMLRLEFPPTELNTIDEVQDTNPCQHEMIRLMTQHGKSICIGDPNQSIFAFRGADSNSMANLTTLLDAKTMGLTVSFRCPRTHVALARRLVPDFEAAPWAIEGDIFLGDSSHLSPRPGDLVLCRMNAPLIHECLILLKDRRSAYVAGRQFGDQLAAIVRRAGDGAATISDLIRGLDKWQAKELRVLADKEGVQHVRESIHDKHMALTAIASSCAAPGEVEEVLATLYRQGADKESVIFSTVHRAKGSENRRVHYLDVPYNERRNVSEWEEGQRRNLRYVAETRSKETMYILDTND